MSPTPAMSALQKGCSVRVKGTRVTGTVVDTQPGIDGFAVVEIQSIRKSRMFPTSTLTVIGKAPR